jgi:hypothetical protein
MKSYFVVLILGLFAAGICFCFCPGSAIVEAEPIPLCVTPLMEGGPTEPAETVRARAVELTWPTTAFSESQMEAAIEATGDLLIDGDPNDIGWAFNVLDQGTEVADNIYGVIGMGLLRAYNLTKEKSGASITAGKPGYLKAAGKVADTLVGGSIALQATDYIFLFLYSDLPGKAGYGTTAAADLAAEVLDGNTRTVSNNLDAKYTGQGRIWQLANWAEACQLAGSAAYADAIVAGIVTDANDYMTSGTGADTVGGFVYDPNNAYVRTLDQARMLEVLTNHYSGTYDTEIAEGLALLKDLQYTNGYFRWGCQMNVDDVTLFTSVVVQDQAFATRAMAFNAQGTWDNYDARIGTYWAANGLLNMQDNGGGFTTNSLTDNISEYNAEALLALHASCREGDVDRSGKVIAGDALSALKAAVGMEDLTGPALLNADRNGDGAISATDALNILQASVGKVVAVNPGMDIGLI